MLEATTENIRRDLRLAIIYDPLLICKNVIPVITLHSELDINLQS